MKDIIEAYTRAAEAVNLLARISGGYIAEALQTLPPAINADDGAIMDCFVTVPELGRVRITAMRMKHKRGRSTHFFWTAESAVPFPQDK